MQETKKNNSETNHKTPEYYDVMQYFTKKTIIVISIIFLLLIIFLYLFVSPKFVQVQVSNQNMKWNQSYSDFSTSISNNFNSYKLPIKFSKDTVKYYSPSTMGFEFDQNKEIDQLKTIKSNLKNRLEIWKKHNLDIAYTVNKDKFNKFLQTNLNIVIQPPENANLSLDSSGQIVLSKSASGHEYGISDGLIQISNHIMQLNKSAISLKVININPVISTTQLKSQEYKINNILKQPVTISIGNNQISVPETQVAPWVNVAINQKNGIVSISINQDNLTKYIQSITSKYTHKVINQVDITNSDGTTTSITQGQNGTSVTGQSLAISSIMSSLLESKPAVVSLNLTTTPFSTTTSLDQNKWIEIDLTIKKMYVYQDNKIIKTFLVSAGKPSTPTPIGTFHILSKIALQTMVGADYVQPNVPWINYFKAGGYAIHGNYWRPATWFGSINSSHGCVGLMVSDAEWVYDWAPLGTTIVTHN